jgi:hypothetical protein
MVAPERACSGSHKGLMPVEAPSVTDSGSVLRYCSCTSHKVSSSSSSGSSRKMWLQAPTPTPEALLAAQQCRSWTRGAACNGNSCQVCSLRPVHCGRTALWMWPTYYFAHSHPQQAAARHRTGHQLPHSRSQQQQQPQKPSNPTSRRSCSCRLRLKQQPTCCCR